MYFSTIREGETPQELSARLHCPVCMLLRVNGLASTAWLWPGRRISVPQEGVCSNAHFPCPVRLARARAFAGEGWILNQNDTAGRIAEERGLPERIVLCCLEGKRAGDAALIPVREKGMRIHTVMPGETWDDFADGESLMLLNGLFAAIYPGMKILIYGE